MIPDTYLTLTEEQLKQKIRQRKSESGEKLVILGHHYQRDEVIEFADHRGDSYGLSQKAAEQKNCRYIVFCGVHFMAEAAAILSDPTQIVQLPDMQAGCPLADFGDYNFVVNAWQEIGEIVDLKRITPITYINSTAELKAFCGQNNGIVCTSSNAKQIMEWALQRSEKIFFFPDQHLGRNTGNKIGIPKNEQILWNPDQPFGGHSPDNIRQAKLILWQGHCHVHTRFKLEHINRFREKYPQGQVIVHPECPEEVVDAADVNGSTSAIINYVEDAPKGATIAVGTEFNLVRRLNNAHPEKKILPLAKSICPNMFKINLHNLSWTLDNPGKVNIVRVPEDVKKYAHIALDRMLKNS